MNVAYWKPLQNSGTVMLKSDVIQYSPAIVWQLLATNDDDVGQDNVWISISTSATHSLSSSSAPAWSPTAWPRPRADEHGRVRDVSIVGTVVVNAATHQTLGFLRILKTNWASVLMRGSPLSRCLHFHISDLTVITIIITLTLSLAQVTTLHWMFDTY